MAFFKSRLAAGIFGVIVATILCTLLARYLRNLADHMSVLPFLAICAALLAVCLGLAHWSDKRDSARKAR